MSSLFQSLELLSHVLHLSVFMGLNLCLWLDHLVLVLPKAYFLGLCLGLGGAEKYGIALSLSHTITCLLSSWKAWISYVTRGKGSRSYSMVRTLWIQPYGLFCRCKYPELSLLSILHPPCLSVNLYRWIQRWSHILDLFLWPFFWKR